MAQSAAAGTLVCFPTELGWMALAGTGPVLQQLTFGHTTAAKAARTLRRALTVPVDDGAWNPRLVRRLIAYAAGVADDFQDVPIDLGPRTAFQTRVVLQLRQIAYGQTVSYGELARRAGSPRAARAVGNCMAGNPIPLVVPCHRVLPSGGALGSYSAPGGASMKARLLAMERYRHNK